MSGDLYDPEAHLQKSSTSLASKGSYLVRKLFWYFLALALGMSGIGTILQFMGAAGNGTFENADPEQAGQMFGTVLVAIIVIFLAFKCLGKAQEVL